MDVIVAPVDYFLTMNIVIFCLKYSSKQPFISGL